MDNIIIKKTVALLRKKAKQNNAKIWNAVAELLSKPKRRRIYVNISKINRYSKDGDIIVVPGKVLGAGIINHKITIGAFKFSESAKKKIEEAGGKCISIIDLVEEQPKGTGVKIIG